MEEVDEQELHVERVAALDLGQAALEACVRVPHAKPGRRLQEVGGDATTTGALLALADWLHSWGHPGGDGVHLRLLDGRLLAAGSRRG